MGVMRSERGGENMRYDRDPDVTVTGTRIRRVFAFETVATARARRVRNPEKRRK